MIQVLQISVSRFADRLTRLTNLLSNSVTCVLVTAAKILGLDISSRYSILAIGFIGAASFKRWLFYLGTLQYQITCKIHTIR